MAIEGRLGDLGIHDVFQLLDVSRKTGTLHVTSADRGNAGTVLFEGGQVVGARIRSNPHRLGDLLVRSGRLGPEDLVRAEAAQRAGDPRRLGELLVALGVVTATEIARQVRLQVEAVVFELMSWTDGWFRFEEGLAGESPEAVLPIAVESLLMEGARRIDEWSRIADVVPSLGMVPVLAEPTGGTSRRLDLRPAEWQVLALVDGVTDLRGIAAAAAMSEFEVARIAYGLHHIEVITLEASPQGHAGTASGAGVSEWMRTAEAAVSKGALTEAITAWESALAAGPDAVQSARIHDGLDAARRLRRFVEAEADA
jgi:hypothetical protein